VTKTAGEKIIDMITSESVIGRAPIVSMPHRGGINARMIRWADPPGGTFGAQ
jgi:hypothetical protein